MAKMNITTARRYLQVLKASHAKYETRDSLAKQIGIYPEVIADQLSEFDPLINLDYRYNLLDLIPLIAIYVEELESQRKKKANPRIVKKDVASYESIGDFIEQKMTIGGSGLIDKNAHLTEKDLRILKRLVSEEQKKRK